MAIRAIASATGGLWPCTSVGWRSGSAAEARATHWRARPGSPRAIQTHADTTINRGRCSSSSAGNNLTVDPEERHNRLDDATEALSRLQSILDSERDSKRLVPSLRNP